MYVIYVTFLKEQVNLRKVVKKFGKKLMASIQTFYRNLKN